MSITEPGAYALTPEEYHGEPCDGPALSASGAITLANECPAYFRAKRDLPREHKPEFDIGTAVHIMALEPDKLSERVVALPYDNYRKAEASEARDACYAAGRTPLLLKQYQLARACADALLADPVARLAFIQSENELSLFWRDAEFGIWCKMRPDIRPANHRYIGDVKTAYSANPDRFAGSAERLGYAQRGAWYLEGMDALYGKAERGYAFLVPSKEPPHLVSVHWLSPRAIEWGRILNRYARGVFAWCHERGEWPGYRPDQFGPPGAFELDLPPWAVARLERLHEAGRFTPPQDMEREAAE